MQVLLFKIYTVLLAGFMIILTVDGQNLPPKRKFLNKNLAEISGLCSQKWNNSRRFWAINDGQNPPVLHFFDENLANIGTVVHPHFLNRDWEAVAADSSGNIFIGDFGNNLNNRRDLRIYIFNPSTQFLDSILFDFPDQHQFPPPLAHRNFDCEAMVWHNNSLHLFTKNVFRGNFWCKHYSLPTSPGTYHAVLQDSIFLKNRVVTDASLSRDGRTLALTTYFFERKWGFLPVSKSSIFFFDHFSGNRFFSGKMKRQKIRKFLLARQVEAVTHIDGKYWLLGNERMAFNRPSLRRFRRK